MLGAARARPKLIPRVILRGGMALRAMLCDIAPLYGGGRARERSATSDQLR
jgi:hypothetical protein